MAGLRVAVRSDTGMQRQHNEDTGVVVELESGRRSLLLVCDGMGGHVGGKVASRTAVAAILGTFLKFDEGTPPNERLEVAIDDANHAVIDRAAADGLTGMGSTCVAAYVDGNRVWVGHVGDSRLYHFRNGAQAYRTPDHSVVQRLVDEGILDAKAAKEHPDANVITRALGKSTTREGAPMKPDMARLQLVAGDTLLLCSDGLYDLVSDQEIAAHASAPDVQAAAARLIRLANDRGGHDNITVAIARYDGAPGGGPGGRTTDPGVAALPGDRPGAGFWRSPTNLLLVALLVGVVGIGAYLVGSILGGGEGDPPAAVASLADGRGAWAPDAGGPSGALPVAVPPGGGGGPAKIDAVRPGGAAAAAPDAAAAPGSPPPADGLGADGAADAAAADAATAPPGGITAAAPGGSGPDLARWLKQPPERQLQQLLDYQRDFGTEAVRTWLGDAETQLQHLFRGATEPQRRFGPPEDVRGTLCRLHQHIQGQSLSVPLTSDWLDRLERFWLSYNYGRCSVPPLPPKAPAARQAPPAGGSRATRPAARQPAAPAAPPKTPAAAPAPTPPPTPPPKTPPGGAPSAAAEPEDEGTK